MNAHLSLEIKPQELKFFPSVGQNQSLKSGLINRMDLTISKLETEKKSLLENKVSPEEKSAMEVCKNILHSQYEALVECQRDRLDTRFTEKKFLQILKKYHEKLKKLDFRDVLQEWKEIRSEQAEGKTNNVIELQEVVDDKDKIYTKIIMPLPDKFLREFPELNSLQIDINDKDKFGALADKLYAKIQILEGRLTNYIAKQTEIGERQSEIEARIGKVKTLRSKFQTDNATLDEIKDYIETEIESPNFADQNDAFGFNWLHYTCMLGLPDFGRKLIQEHHIKIDIKALHLIIESSHPENVLNQFFKLFEDFNKSLQEHIHHCSTEGRAVIHLAALHGNLIAFQWLVRKGADIKAIDRSKDGGSPLHIASMQGHVEIVNVLLQIIDNDREKTEVLYDVTTNRLVRLLNDADEKKTIDVIGNSEKVVHVFSQNGTKLSNDDLELITQEMYARTDDINKREACLGCCSRLFGLQNPQNQFKIIPSVLEHRLNLILNSKMLAEREIKLFLFKIERFINDNNRLPFNAKDASSLLNHLIIHEKKDDPYSTNLIGLFKKAKAFDVFITEGRDKKIPLRVTLEAKRNELAPLLYIQAGHYWQAKKANLVGLLDRNHEIAYLLDRPIADLFDLLFHLNDYEPLMSAKKRIRIQIFQQIITAETPDTLVQAIRNGKAILERENSILDPHTLAILNGIILKFEFNNSSSINQERKEPEQAEWKKDLEKHFKIFKDFLMNNKDRYTICGDRQILEGLGKSKETPMALGLMR